MRPHNCIFIERNKKNFFKKGDVQEEITFFQFTRCREITYSISKSYPLEIDLILNL